MEQISLVSSSGISTCKTFTFGFNASGQLGVGSDEPQTGPKLVEKLIGKNVIIVAAGYHHSRKFSC